VSWLGNKRVDGQNKYKCCIVGCNETGRKFGNIGDVIIAYCPKHRKIGEKIMNFLFDSKKRYFRTKLLYKVKHSLLFENEPAFCPDCQKKLINFLNKAIKEIDEGNEFIETEYEYPLREPSLEDDDSKDEQQ